MNGFRKTMFALLGCLILAAAATSAGAQDQTAAERKERVLANLKLAFPQLEDIPVAMGVIGPSDYAGLDEGTFTVNNRPQKFFISSDDTKLYLVSADPIDVSRSMAEIQAELDERAAEEATQAKERTEQLANAVEGRPFRGAADAKVTIVEFSDFQCPYCSRGAETVEQILEKYPNDVKFVFQHFPLGFHPWAKPAAIASHCGGLQSGDAFWTLHDKYFEHQSEITPDNVIEMSKKYLEGSGIDMDAWVACATDQESEEYKAAAATVEADMARGQGLGVSGTPGFFVNGAFLNGAQPIAAFEPLIQAAIAASE